MMNLLRRRLLKWSLGAQALALVSNVDAAVPALRGNEPVDGAASTPPAPRSGHDGRHDFDFLHGQWRVRSERLAQRLAGSDDWQVFHADQHCQPLLGGLGNLDEFVSDWTRPGQHERFIGMTLRLFNPESRQWSLYWAGNHDGVLEAPVVGGFRDGVGTFYGRLEHDGRPVLARFTWERLGGNAAHWHQAFSADEGRHWETNWHMWLRRLDAHGRPIHDDAVVELRQYTLQPGRREELIELFEREFIEPQEAVGMHVIGQFRDLDAPDRFVWLRGFPGMAERAASLQGFYGGPTWRRHRDGANATMIDSDDVLLLRPARAGSGLPASPARARDAGSADAGAGLVEAGVCLLDAHADDGFLARFEQTLAPRLRAAGADLLGVYVTETSANTFPRLPVREGEQALVWLARFDDVPAHHRYEAALVADGAWRSAVAAALLDGLKQPPQRLRLAPTPRSELRA